MLTERDRDLVRWVGRLGAAQTEQLMHRYSLGRTVAYRRVRELVDYELLERRRLLYGESALLVATQDGLRFAGLHDLTRARISLALVEHMTTCAWLAAAMEPNLVGQRLLTDREHRAIESATGRPLASAVTGTHPDGRLQLHRPDLVLISDAEGGQMVAIEVELTLKTRTRLERILRGYARNRRLASVRYYARPSIAEAVRRAADRSGAADLVDIRPLPQVCNGDRRGHGHQHEAGGHHERRRGAA